MKKFILSIAVFLTAVFNCILYGQNSLKLKKIVEASGSLSERKKFIPLIDGINNFYESDDYLISETSYYFHNPNTLSVKGYSHVFAFDKESLELNEITLLEKESKKIFKEKTGESVRDLLKMSCFYIDENTRDFIFTFRVKDKSSDKPVVKTVLFRKNKQNNLIDFKVLFQIPSLSSSNYGNVVKNYYTKDKSKICIVNTLPVEKGRNQIIEMRLFDAKNFNLINIKQIELPIIYDDKAKNVTFSHYNFENGFVLYHIIGEEKDKKKDEPEDKVFLAIFFNENEDFQPKLTTVPLKHISNIDDYAVCKSSTADFALGLALTHEENSKKYVTYTFLDLEKNKTTPFKTIEVPYKNQFSLEIIGLYERNPGELIAHIENQRITITREFYTSRSGTTTTRTVYNKEIFNYFGILLKDDLFNEIYKFSSYVRFGSLGQQLYKVLPLDETNSKFILYCNYYSRHLKKILEPNLKLENEFGSENKKFNLSELDGKPNVYFVSYFIIDTYNTELKPQFLFGKYPDKDKLVDVLALPVLNKPYGKVFKRFLLISYPKFYIGSAEFQ